ncbi:stage II sporulation protein M [Bacillus mojavensis]|nr:stage II sporulation protein M [Bacillus mojavensis]MEC1612195.1 stage II sporulation protein M [Bacillus mojavensis]MEC1623227.1 stage II sporulation protein M [Bacillus mojavensis]MEC1659442.1 stage II sporulation protein M [Bacillus mojavensis]MEC1683320.1 stage II sporulation protein M [Bacillus mojavensis]MEC1693701.1 stage II sporulation protein M [Bacillus mojavensis]
MWSIRRIEFEKVFFCLLIYLFVMLIPFFLSDSMHGIITFNNESKSFISILKNNVTVIFTGVFLGAISCGLIGFIIILINAFYLGETLILGIIKYGPSFLFSILPHGLFEVPGTVIVMVILWEINKFLFSKLYPLKTNYTFHEFSRKIREYFILSILLISIGALVEAYITPILIERFLL